jgi:peptidoglycan hydrolase-like protein with peptidoglycan-binding domain
MGKSLALSITNASCVVQCGVFCLLALDFGKPTVAVEINSVIPMVAQATPATTINRPTLQLGSEGAAVSELQAALKLLGYYTDTVDGVYRESTASAVSYFQQAAGLNADGIAGTATWSRLFPSMSSVQQTPPTSSSNTPASGFPVPSSLQTTNTRPSTMPTMGQVSGVGQIPAPIATNSVTLPILREGMQGPAVVQLQERLKALGFLGGTIDGVFGTATQSAVIAAQQNFQIEPDGVVGPATWRALLR